MNHNLNKKNFPFYNSAIIIVLFSFLSILIINSCRKEKGENSSTPASAALIKNNIDINLLKTNYLKGINGSKLKPSDISQQTFGKIIGSLNVDWTSYVLTTYPDSTQIIEFAMPDDTTLVSPTALKNNDTLKYHTKTAAVFIIRKDTVNMSFFMKTTEDCTAPGYQSVLPDVHYNIIPSTFTGNVMYFTLDKQYINGYSWLAGILNKTISIDASTQQPQNNQLNKNRTDELAVVDCNQEIYDFYNLTISGGQITHADYIGTVTVTTCTIVGTISNGSGSSGGSTPGVSGGGGGVAGATPQPPPCPTAGASVSAIKGRLQVDVVQGGTGSTGGTTSPCSVVTTTPATPPVFGLNKSNAQIPDENFDNYLNYVASLNYTYSDPFNTTLTVNGVNYTGQITEVYDTNNQLVASYFSPDVTSGPFQTGMEYNIGNGNAGTVSSATSAPVAIFGTVSSTVGTGSGTYTVPSGGGGARTNGATVLVENPTTVTWSDDPDNVVYTDPNPAVPTPYQQSTPWPTIPNVVPFSDFVPFRFKSPGVEENCLVLSKEELGKMGYTCSGYLPGSQTFQTYTSSANKTITNEAVTYIISALSQKIPVLAGVDAYPGSPYAYGDGVTDHYIVIDGMGTDAKGHFFHFIDSSTSDPGKGDYYNNRLYYNSTTGVITGTCNTGYTSQKPGGHNYIVTQIRKSIKQ